LRVEIEKEKERLNRLICKIMLTDITKDEEKLEVIVSLYQK